MNCSFDNIHNYIENNKLYAVLPNILETTYYRTETLTLRILPKHAPKRSKL